MIHVILPQTIKIILPPMVNQVVALIKNTSCMLLAGGALDLISITNAFAVGESTARYAKAAYLFSAVLFFAICFPLSTLAARWESNLKKREASAGTGAKPPDQISDAELDDLIARGGAQTKGG